MNKTNKTLRSTKMLMSITTIGLLGASFANAQDLNQTQNTQTNFGQRVMQTLTDAQKKVLDEARNLFQSGKKTEADALLKANGIEAPQKGKHGGHGNKGKHGDKKAIHEAIASGNYQTFQTLASTTPLKSIDQATFNLLTPHFTAKKNAEEQIRSILKAAGVQTPETK